MDYKEAHEIPIPLGPLRYHGVINTNELFNAVRGWLASQQYDFYETATKHKTSGEGLKKEYEWDAERKVNDYVKQKIKIFFFIYNIAEVEVIRKGEKQKLLTGRLQIEINGILILDQQGRFGKLPKFAGILYELYMKYIIHKDIWFVWADGFYYHILKLQTHIKNHLDMEAKYSAK